MLIDEKNVFRVVIVQRCQSEEEESGKTVRELVKFTIEKKPKRAFFSMTNKLATI